MIENTSAGTVTIAGGVVLTNATNSPAGETSIYGAADFVSGLSNPITITFQNPVTNFLVDVLNGETSNRNFTVADNVGHSSMFTLVPNTSSGATTIGFAATGTQITVTQSGGAGFDLEIDNIMFNVPIVCTTTSCQQGSGTSTSTPEPASFALLGVPLVVAVFHRRRNGAV